MVNALFTLLMHRDFPVGAPNGGHVWQIFR
jgi:hypothetical protein